MEPLTMETAGELAVKTPWKFLLHEDFDLYAAQAPELVTLAHDHFAQRMKSIITQRLQIVHGQHASAFVLTRYYEPLPVCRVLEQALLWLGRPDEVPLLQARREPRLHPYLCLADRGARRRGYAEEALFFDEEEARRLPLDQAFEAKATAMAGCGYDGNTEQFGFWLRLSAVLEQDWPWQALVPRPPAPPPPAAQPLPQDKCDVATQAAMPSHRDYDLARQMSMSLSEFVRRTRGPFG